MSRLREGLSVISGCEYVRPDFMAHSERVVRGLVGGDLCGMSTV